MEYQVNDTAMCRKRQLYELDYSQNLQQRVTRRLGGKNLIPKTLQLLEQGH